VVQPSASNSSWYTGELWNGVYFVLAPGFTGNTVRFSQARQAQSTEDFYLVSRLDGPGGVTRILDLVDQAIYADKYINLHGNVTKWAYAEFLSPHLLQHFYIIKFLWV
jgi:hypothetical protein